MILGLIVNKIEATRKVNEKIMNMRFNINFDEVKATDENVNVDFTFTAVYEGEQQGKTAKTIGEMNISGTLYSKESKKKADEIIDMWKSDKKTLPTWYAEDVINALRFECGSKGTLVSYSIGFPAPLQLSMAKIQEPAAGNAT